MSDDQRKIEIAETTQVMSTESGRNFVWRILKSTGVDDDTFDTDTHNHARNAGRRGVGLQLRDELKAACFDNYLRMMKENECS